MNTENHKNQIIEQFTNQAASYTSLASHSDALDKLIRIASPKKDDRILDVACGSGIVSLAFAKHTGHVTGLDITQEMINEAKRRQLQEDIKNVDWVIGEADAMPFPDQAFSAVITRFSFHHFMDPQAVINEMIRVCCPGGTIMITDVAVTEKQALMYDRMEKLRDPSHVKVLSSNQFKTLFETNGLKNIRTDNYDMEIDLEQQLNASFPTDREVLKKLIIGDVNSNQIGVNVKQFGEKFRLYYPVLIIAGEKS